MTTTTYQDTWDLDVFFPGGSESKEFATYITSLQERVESFTTVINNWEAPTSLEEATSIHPVLHTIAELSQSMRQAGAFVSCLEAQNVHDTKANEWRGRMTRISATLQKALGNFEQTLALIDDELWNQMLGQEDLTALAFVLNERRDKANEKASLQEEAVMQTLAVDGYHGWGQLYNQLVKRISIEVEVDGETKKLSAGQASNLFSHPDRSVRKDAFEKWEAAWDEQSDLLGKTLNHLAGFRLGTYETRGWDNVLHEPLRYNRMQEETLTQMWSTITKHKPKLVEFLERKAQLLGVDQLSWYDMDAPIGTTGSKRSYTEGAAFILEQFAQFGEELTAFTKNAFENRWIEAEDRAGKRPGGFCTGFPEDGQSRIFMTYSGTPSNISTLAHELGHAFHSYAMRDIHPLNRQYAMNVAETASTFAEMIVSDASVRNAQSKDEKIALLEDKIQRSVALLMNIHARFLFETRFYEERKNGMVSVDRLKELMTDAQNEAYCGALSDVHPMFWGAKLHFYITGVPFYNFPYTFGYLFSLGIYGRALEKGTAFERDYMALLQDTASMTVEDLAQKHLHVDLTSPAFWEDALKPIVADIDEFLELTK